MASNSRTGPRPGVSSHDRSVRRPFGVMEYTVRGRFPVCSLVALASPWATRFLGSS